MHDITNDAKLVKVATTTFGAKGLFECDLHGLAYFDEYISKKTYLDIVNVLAVPGSAKELVAETKNENVLDHFLAQVVVNAENLFLFPVGLQGLL